MSDETELFCSDFRDHGSQILPALMSSFLSGWQSQAYLVRVVGDVYGTTAHNSAVKSRTPEARCGSLK
jgi:hypothetical protein